MPRKAPPASVPIPVELTDGSQLTLSNEQALQLVEQLLPRLSPADQARLAREALDRPEVSEVATAELTMQARRYSRQKRRLARGQLGLPDDDDATDAPDAAQLAAEASEPTTDGARLEELYRSNPHATALRLRLLSNPSLPPELLKELLLDQTLEPLEARLAVWHNPAVDLLLMVEPQPEYLESVRLLLLRCQGAPRMGTPIDVLVSGAERLVRLGKPGEKDQPRIRLARRVAGLFGLPWSDPRPSPEPPSSDPRPSPETTAR